MRTQKLFMLFLAAAPVFAQETVPPSDLIRDAQTRLAGAGFEPGLATGSMNPATTDAVQRFEERIGRPQTGVATPQLIENLKLLNQIQNLTYPCKFFNFEADSECTLKNGSAEIDYFEITLSEFIAIGDLDGNETQDAVAMFDAYGGGNSVMSYMVAMLNTDGTLKPVASEYFSGPMLTLTINQAGILSVRMVGYREDDAHCCPTLPSETQFHLRDQSFSRGWSRELGKGDVESLIPSLRSHRHEEQRTAAQVLGFIAQGDGPVSPHSPAEAAVPELTKALSVDDESFRMDCLTALGQIGSAAKSAIPEILRNTQIDRTLGERSTAIETLIALQAPPDLVVPELKKILNNKKDGSEYFRSVVEQALRHFEQQQQ